MPLLSRDEMPNWTRQKSISGTEISTKVLRNRNETGLANKLEAYVLHYYDVIQMFHVCLALWCAIVMVLGCINIVPKHEDFKVCTILLVSYRFLVVFQYFSSFVPPANHHDGHHGNVCLLRFLRRFPQTMQATAFASLVFVILPLFCESTLFIVEQ